MRGRVGRRGRGVSCLLRISCGDALDDRLPVGSLSISSHYMVFEFPEDPDRDDHSECRDCESRMESELLTNDLHHYRREKRTDVDTHIKNVVSAILEVTAFGIKIADHRRDVRFEEAISDDKAGQRGVNRPELRNRQQSVTGHK